MHLDVRMKGQETVEADCKHFHGARNKEKHGLSLYCFAAGTEDEENHQIFSPFDGVIAQSGVWMSCICCYMGWLSLRSDSCLQSSWSSVRRPSVIEITISEEEQWAAAGSVFA